ncbi:MAG: hypothetical protein IJJ33_09605, partial [Victivallales bacterium]|nr:hypothetical protein [Victivallales bacterium]
SSQKGRVLELGAYRIENTLLPGWNKESALTDANRPQLWRSFMHAVTDEQATPIAWQSITSRPDEIPLDDSPIDLLFKQSTMPAIKLAGKSLLPLDLPVLDSGALQKLRGQTLRFFVWIKAEQVGQGTDLWNGAPRVSFLVNDGTGATVAKAQSAFKTRGTYPWFCYYVNVDIPLVLAPPPAPKATEEAGEPPAEGAAAAAPAAESVPAEELVAEATLDDDLLGGQEKTVTLKPLVPAVGGLYIILENPASGTVWFSTLSWQRIPRKETIMDAASRQAKTDPKYGSLAPNAEYDELPMHLIGGLSEGAKWAFLKGNQAFKDLTDADSAVAYINAYADDWLHAIHAIPYLVYVWSNGTLLKTAPEFEEGWPQKVIAAIRDRQDPVTGFWKVNGQPNLLATWTMAANAFHPTQTPRPGAPVRPTPWLAVDDGVLPHPGEIIDTLLREQRTSPRRQAKGGWNNYIFQPASLEAPGQSSTCDIAATTAAVRLLAQCVPLVEPEVAAKANAAIRDAWSYIFNHLIYKNGVWLKSEADATSTTPSTLFELLDATPWLAIRVNAKLPALLAEAKVEETGKVSAVWQPAPQFVSLRVYAAPASVKDDQLSEQHLVGVLQPNGDKQFQQKDPLDAARFLATAAMSRWGITPASEGANYIASRLESIPKNTKFLVADRGDFQVAPAKEPITIRLAGVTAYGEHSPLLTISPP